MVGESYIVRDDLTPNPKTRRIRLNDERSAYDRFMENPHPVNNLVWFDSPQLRSDELHCSFCHKKRIPMTKQQLLKVGLTGDFKEKVIRECNDGQTYSFCPGCANYHIQPTLEVQPISKCAVMCVKCQFTHTMGERLTLSPKLMHENIEDENKVIRLGEPTALSPKKWYWSCSACGHREEMLKSSLRKTFVQNNTFIISQKGKQKLTMSREEQEEVKGYFGGYPTSKVDERDEPPPGY